MSKFHESVREVLEDVHKFLAVTLNTEILSTTALSSREGLLTKLSQLRQDYPQLHLHLLSKGPPIHKQQTLTRFDSSGEKDGSVSPSSPPPYVDMQGNGNNSLSAEPLDEDYEVCSNEKSPLSKEYLNENKSLNDSEEVAVEEEKESIAVAAADLTKAEKCGYLEKKGKERLGGLFNPFQRRWCAIKNGVMYYFERPTDRHQKGQIILEGYEAKLNRTGTKDANKRDLCFELACPGKKSFQFVAVTPKDLKQWLSAIERNSRPVTNVNPCDSGEAETCETIKDAISGSGESDDDNIYEMVEETGDQRKSLKMPNSNDNEPIYDEGESYTRAEDEELYTEAESSVSQEEWDEFNPQDWYVGLWNCKGEDRNELDFSRGDLIHIVSREYDSFAWWVGEFKGKVGLVPKSYLMEAYEAV